MEAVSNIPPCLKVLLLTNRRPGQSTYFESESDSVVRLRERTKRLYVCRVSDDSTTLSKINILACWYVLQIARRVDNYRRDFLLRNLYEYIQAVSNGSVDAWWNDFLQCYIARYPDSILDERLYGTNLHRWSMQSLKQVHWVTYFGEVLSLTFFVATRSMVEP